MEKVEIEKWKLEEIDNALRLVINVNKCKSKITCFDRLVMKSKSLTEEILNDL